MTDDIAEQLRDIAFKKCGPTMEAVHTKLIEWKAAAALEAQARRIAELEKMLALSLAVDVDALKARIAELAAALREFNFYLILDSDKDTDTLPVLIGHIRAARAAYLGEKE